MDWGTRITIFLTLILFIVALFVKGFGHGLLLEAGVFLVSAKLIILAYHNHVSNERIQSQLEEIQAQLRKGPPARASEAQERPPV